MDQKMTAITRTPQRGSSNSLATERDYYVLDFTLHDTGQFEMADILEKLRRIDTKLIIDRFSHVAISGVWAGYSKSGSFTISPEDKHPGLMTFDDPNRSLYIKYQILQRPLLERLETLREKVRGYQLDEDITWPTEQAYEDAKRFIRLLPLSKIHVPEIYFPHDGEITFLWDEQDCGLYVDLGFYGDETYSYFATDDSGKELMEGKASICQELPDDLVDMLKV